MAGDCDPRDGPDVDVCVAARTIEGVTFNLVFENPDVLVAGARVPVVSDGSAAACDDVTGHAVVDLRRDGGQERASGGTVATATVGDRLAATFDLRFPSGDRLTGQLDVALD